MSSKASPIHAEGAYVKKLLKMKKPKTTDLISNFDIYAYVDKSLPIIETYNLTSDTDLFNNPFKATVLLINSSEGNHWVLINKFKNKIEFFNSYGTDFYQSPELEMIHYLSGVVSNRIQFQEYSPKMNSCGKWILFRLMTLLEFKMNLEGNNKLIKRLCKTHKETPDEIVCSLFVTDI